MATALILRSTQGTCLSLSCHKQVDPNSRGSARCPHCRLLLWCSRLCQLRDRGLHSCQCESLSQPKSQLRYCGNSSCRSPILRKHHRALSCVNCSIVKWCNRLCLSQDIDHHHRVCPDPPRASEFRATLHPTHSPDELASRLAVASSNSLFKRAGVYAKRLFEPGECIVVEAPLAAVRSLEPLMLTARSLAAQLDVQQFNIEDAATITYSANIEQSLINLGAHYSVPYDPDLKERNLIVHHYSVPVISPLSGRPEGRALYQYNSFLKHHCRPNVHRVMDGDYRCLVFAIERIEVGNELHCSHTIPETSILPVQSRYNLVQHTLMETCRCGACSSETKAIREQDGIAECFPLNQPDVDCGWVRRPLEEGRDPVLGGEPLRRTLEEISKDVEVSNGADWPMLEMMYAVKDDAPLVFLRQGDIARTAITELPEMWSDCIGSHQASVVVMMHVAETLRLIDAGQPPIQPHLLAELITFLRWIASGHWRCLRLSLKYLYKLATQVSKQMILVLMGPAPLHVYGELQLWIRTWAMLKALEPLLPPLRDVVEVVEQMPIALLDHEGLSSTGTFTPLFCQMLISELQLNHSVGFLPSWVEAVRDLAVPVVVDRVAVPVVEKRWKGRKRRA